MAGWQGRAGRDLPAGGSWIGGIIFAIHNPVKAHGGASEAYHTNQTGQDSMDKLDGAGNLEAVPVQHFNHSYSGKGQGENGMREFDHDQIVSGGVE